MGTYYNILYNGNIALESGRATVDNAATDNYWELLPVERMEIKDDLFLPGQAKNQDFERTETKAIKAVQKHGMNIKGKEYNPQIDEAYLLLGEARYFDQRFIPALEAFNYILYKYPTSDKINTAKVWREKTNMRLDNDDLAIENLKRLLEQEELEDQDLADATSALAQAYINTKSKDSAITQLRIAAEFTRKKKEEARFNYIIGQLYNEFGKIDSANMAFDHIIDMHRKIPRPYYINAHLAKAANFDTINGNEIEFLEYLTDLEEDRENRPYLDKIYYRIAEFHRGNSRDSLAIAYYNKSLRASTSDKILKAKDYETLGNMVFDKAEYKIAGAYYDSTMNNLTLNSRPYRIIKRKRENLDDVIYYEGIAQANDSILKLVNFSEDERLAYFTEYTDELKRLAEIKAEKAEAEQRLVAGLQDATNTNQVTQNSRKTAGVGPPNNQTFYFYNQTTVSYGKNEFIQVWGDRELKDNWRLSSSKRSSFATAVNDSLVDDKAVDPRLMPETYLSQIPNDPTVIDSLAKERNFAYYQLGNIYKEKFKEYQLAKNKLEILLNNNPEERLILPSKYNLYKIYIELGLDSKAQVMKSEIISDYPDSRYAEILLNPETGISSDENSPEKVYAKLYNAFENQNYARVITKAEEYVKQFAGDPMVPKFEILIASAKGRLFGFEQYKEAVNYVALTYPNTEEGKQAEVIMKESFPAFSRREFSDNDSAKHFNVLYPFKKDEFDKIEKFQKKLDKEIKEIRYFELSTSVDVYTEDVNFVVVHGLNSIQGALGFADILKERKVKINREHYSISSPNYVIIQRHKNLDQYLESQ